MKPRRCVAVALLGFAVIGCGSSSVTPAPSSTSPSGPPSAATPGASRSPVGSIAPPPSATPIALPQGSDPIELDPALFAGVPIDHPFWPMTPGSRWVYREGRYQDVEVTVTSDTKEILGIQATVVRDIVSVNGEVLEDTFDWYAQDVFGNLWYLGEDTKEYQNGQVVSTAGSWEAGVDGAQAGIILPAELEVGTAYRQEYYAGHAEDNGKILALDEDVEVPFGTFDGCLKTEDTTALDPSVLEHKFYAEGVGLVEVTNGSGAPTEVLVSYEPGS